MVAYNDLVNLWPRFGQVLYLPLNLGLGAVLLVVAKGRWGLDAADLGLRGPLLGDLLLGVLMGAALVAPLLAAALHPRLAVRIADRRIRGMGPAQLAYNVLLRIPLGTALVEELAFRGVLFGAWRYLGDWQAALASSVCFGLWHITPGFNMARVNRPGAPLAHSGRVVAITVVVTTAAGMAFVWLRLRSGGLALPVGLHASLNGLATLAAALAVKRLGSRPAPADV